MLCISRHKIGVESFCLFFTTNQFLVMKSMTPRPEKIIVVNGRELQFLFNDMKWWVALKPICEALDVDYKRAHANLKEDEFLDQLSSLQRMVGADGRQREMLCLPHTEVYGWILTLQSDSPILKEYRWKCYRVLYNYFTGSLDTRSELLHEMRRVDADIYELDQKLTSNMDYVKLEGLKGRKREISKQLKALDDSLISPQLNLFNTNNPQLS